MLDRSQWIAMGLVSGFAYILGKDRESFGADENHTNKDYKNMQKDLNKFVNTFCKCKYSKGAPSALNIYTSCGYCGKEIDEVSFYGLTKDAESFEAEVKLYGISGDVKIESTVRRILADINEGQGFADDEYYYLTEEERDEAYNDMEFDAESFEAEKKNCGCGQDPCVTYGAEIMGSVGDIENHSVDKYKTKHFLTDKELSDFLIKHGTNHDSIRKNKKAKGNIIISTPEGGWISEAKFSLSQPDNENDKDMLMIIPDDYLGIHQDAEFFGAEDSQKMEVTFKIQDADYATFYYTTDVPSELRRDEDIVSYVWGDECEPQDEDWFYCPYDWNGVGEHYLAKVMNKTLKAESFEAEDTNDETVYIISGMEGNIIGTKKQLIKFTNNVKTITGLDDVLTKKGVKLLLDSGMNILDIIRLKKSGFIREVKKISPDYTKSDTFKEENPWFSADMWPTIKILNDLKKPITIFDEISYRAESFEAEKKNRVCFTCSRVTPDWVTIDEGYECMDCVFGKKYDEDRLRILGKGFNE